MATKLLLTGASGAIGCHVLAYVLEKTDWEVVATDSFSPTHKGYFDRLTEVIKPEWTGRVKIVQHDLLAPFTDREIESLGKIDYIVNLASRSDVQNSIEDPLPFIRNNTELMLTMVELAKKIKPLTFLHFSTDEVYGPVAKDSGGHTEWDAILPSNPYSASKACQEAIAISYWRSFGLPLIITNTMNNFGEMQAPSKFPAMIQQKLERNEQIEIHASTNNQIGTRYYIHSRNTADAILFILKNVKPVIHEPGEMDRPIRLNIVGDKQLSNLELVNHIAKLMDKKPRTKLTYFHEKNAGHDLHYGLNGEKLSQLGWKSPIPFEESLKMTIDWQKAHPEWQK